MKNGEKMENPYMSHFIKDGEKMEMPHVSLQAAKNWLGYMISWYQIKPLRIENLETGEVIKENLFNRW